MSSLHQQSSRHFQLTTASQRLRTASGNSVSQEPAIKSEPGQPAEFVSTSTTSNGADGGRNRDEDDEDDEEPQGPSREFLLIRRPSYRKILSDLGGSIHMIPGKENTALN